MSHYWTQASAWIVTIQEVLGYTPTGHAYRVRIGGQQFIRHADYSRYPNHRFSDNVWESEIINLGFNKCIGRQ